MSKQPTTNRKSNEQASTGSRPTHRVFAVSDAPEGQKAFWHDIGAAWEHQDGKGFNVVLQLLPNQGQKIVMRINEPRDSGEE
jgi:hypothetical protein